MSVFHWPPAGLRAFVSRTLRTLAFLGLLLLPLAAGASPVPLGRAASAPAELVVTFKEVAVLASELSPGGDAVFFSVAREPQGAFNRIVRRSGVEVVDGLGEALFEPAEGFVPPKSVWVVADVATGGFAVAAPEGFLLRQVPFPGIPVAQAPGVFLQLVQAGPEDHTVFQLHLDQGFAGRCQCHLRPFGATRRVDPHRTLDLRHSAGQG